MKNYVIINGVNSLTITGLAISKLPSISKPPLRVMTEEINGRDGDLITELGYGAYDKELVIGLYGNYDINEVIGFFNQEGTIVFSNEDDKYYNFKIINQIDYEALIKFRTATISLHCQPFKYPLTETPEEITTEYVEDEGETLTLNDTKIAPLSIDLKGNTSQTGTPTPSSPINVNVVSGDNEVVVCGKNLISAFTNNLFANNSKDYIQTASNLYGCIGRVKPNTTYTIKRYGGNRFWILSTSGYPKYQEHINTIFNENNSIIEKTFTTGANDNYIFCYYSNESADIDIQLEVGSTATPYEPYTSQNYPLYLGVENLFDKSTATSQVGYFSSNGTLNGGGSSTVITSYIPIQPNTQYYLNGNTLENVCYYDENKTFIERITSNPRSINKNAYFIRCQFTTASFDLNTIELTKGSTPQHISDTPIELNKIGTYQDYIYKDNGNWYLHKEIGKVVLDGSSDESINLEANLTNVSRFRFNNIVNAKNQTDTLCNSNVMNTSYGSDTPHYYILSNLTNVYYFIDNSLANSVATFRTWLSNNNVIVYYVLSTPTTTEITNTTLIGQLEDLKGAMSYEGQTNISQINNDLPFILKVKGTKEGSGEGIINNIGNIYAKPIIELEGTGTIGIYKNGTQCFEVDMSSDNEITIDTEKMEAYHNGVLKNRKVIGDYNKFTIDEGNNNIEITGELTKATITKYVRYL